jgi:hypothetical protein
MDLSQDDQVSRRALISLARLALSGAISSVDAKRTGQRLCREDQRGGHSCPPPLQEAVARRSYPKPLPERDDLQAPNVTWPQ